MHCCAVSLLISVIFSFTLPKSALKFVLVLTWSFFFIHLVFLTGCSIWMFVSFSCFWSSSMYTDYMLSILRKGCYFSSKSIIIIWSNVSYSKFYSSKVLFNPFSVFLLLCPTCSPSWSNESILSNFVIIN